MREIYNKSWIGHFSLDAIGRKEQLHRIEVNQELRRVAVVREAARRRRYEEVARRRAEEKEEEEKAVATARLGGEKAVRLPAVTRAEEPAATIRTGAVEGVEAARAERAAVLLAALQQCFVSCLTPATVEVSVRQPASWQCCSYPPHTLEAEEAEEATVAEVAEEAEEAAELMEAVAEVRATMRERLASLSSASVIAARPLGSVGLAASGLPAGLAMATSAPMGLLHGHAGALLDEEMLEEQHAGSPAWLRGVRGEEEEQGEDRGEGGCGGGGASAGKEGAKDTDEAAQAKAVKAVKAVKVKAKPEAEAEAEAAAARGALIFGDLLKRSPHSFQMRKWQRRYFEVTEATFAWYASAEAAAAGAPPLGRLPRSMVLTARATPEQQPGGFEVDLGNRILRLCLCRPERGTEAPQPSARSPAQQVDLVEAWRRALLDQAVIVTTSPETHAEASHRHRAKFWKVGQPGSSGLHKDLLAGGDLWPALEATCGRLLRRGAGSQSEANTPARGEMRCDLDARGSSHASRAVHLSAI